MGWQQKKAQRNALRQAVAAEHAAKTRAAAKAPRILSGIREALDLIEERRFEEADEILNSLGESYTDHPEVLRVQALVAAKLKDASRQVALLERLANIQPDAFEAYASLFPAYLAEGCVLHALRTLRRLTGRWPDMVEGSAESLAKLEAELPEQLELLGLTGENAFEHGLMHERVRLLISQSRYADSRREAERLIGLRPTFMPARNNLAEAAFAAGDYAVAASAAREALTVDPQNAFARASLVRSLVFLGRLAEAQAEAAALRQLSGATPDGHLKIVEALSLLGDDETVLAWAEDWAVKGGGSPLINSRLDQFAAVALYRLGREAEARKRWQRSRKHAFSPDLVADNLDDLSQPIGRRHGCWANPINYWMSKALFDEFGRRAKRDQNRDDAARRFLADHPELEVRIPLMLDRGDPFARELALITAQSAGTPPMLAALKDFALGTRGPDELRMRAAMAVDRAGLMPPGPIRMWREGEWKETGFRVYTIHWEAKDPLPPDVEELAAEAEACLHDRNGEAAEAFLRAALQLDPDCPTLLFNLSSALRLQGWVEDADDLVRDIHQQFPEYFFGIVGSAQLAIADCRLDEARGLLNRVSDRTEYHVTEFSMLVIAEVAYWLARQSRSAALEWVKMLEQLNPDDDNLPVLRTIVGVAR